MVEQDQIAVQTAGLTKTFRDFWLREKVTAVKDLDLTVRRGEIYGLLGPNGSGKSTTLKMVLGLMFPTAGKVAVFGKPPRDVMTKSRIGFLPEESYLYPFLDARETLDYYGRLFRQPRHERRKRIDMLLDMVGLASVAYRRIGEYSKGMQRRIGMAQALINDPDLLILDEPTSGMDPLAARQFKDLIQELSQRGKTVILSSHLLADMEDLCDRVAILFAGTLRSEGTLDQLLARGSMTQITTEALDPATQQRLLDLLKKSDKQVLAVETPKDKLETLFLRIIHEAQLQRMQVQTAVNTGQVAEFLRAEAQPQQVLEELTRPARPVEPEKPVSPIAVPAPVQPVGQVIEELVAPKKAKPEAPAAPQTPPPAPKVEADRAVLDQLLGKKDADA